MSHATDQQILPAALLLKMAERAAAYDEENRFFHEDFEDLRAAGYLTACVPREFGGQGLDLAALCREQRRLAYHAPATALGIHMHLYWTGLAADLWSRGDRSLEWLLREAAAGEVFASGHSEHGNDLPVLLSTSKAEKVEGGFRVSGRKMFGSLAPVWTRYGTNAMWRMRMAAPRSSTVSCPGTAVVTASSKRGAPWACARPEAMMSSWRTRLLPADMSQG